MSKIKSVDKDQYEVDFDIAKGYIDFSSEILRLSLFALGGIGTLILKIKSGEEKFLHNYLTNHSYIIMASLVLFLLAAAATLFHRYYASDWKSWYICYLRAKNEAREAEAEDEKTGYRKILKLAKWSLIFSEFFFGGGIVFFIISILKLIN
jgi:hypothetical protein